MSWFNQSHRHSLAAKGIRTSLRTKAWPFGEGQTRLHISRGKLKELEPASIEIDTLRIPKSHKSPLTEEDIKEIVESGKPGEVGSVREVLITDRGTPYGSYGHTFGEAFKGGRIKLYSKPYKKLKGYDEGIYLKSPKRGYEEIPESEMKEFYENDVLPHEIGHVQLGHGEKSVRDKLVANFPDHDMELQAEKFAKKWREEKGIEFNDYGFDTRGSDALKSEIMKAKNEEVQLHLYPSTFEQEEKELNNNELV